MSNDTIEIIRILDVYPLVDDEGEIDWDTQVVEVMTTEGLEELEVSYQELEELEEDLAKGPENVIWELEAE